MKKKITLVFLIVAGAVLGGVLANLCYGVQYFDWLSYSKSLGLDTVTLDIIAMKLTFGIQLNISVAQIVCCLIALLFYPKILKLLDA